MIAQHDLESHYCILLVENDPGCRKLAESILSHLGFQCITAQNGAEALRFAQIAQIDLIITDITLPDGDGLQIAQSIRTLKKYGDLPLIFVTGLSDIESRMKATGITGVTAIQKPYRVAQFRQVVVKTLEHTPTEQEGLRS